MDRRLNKRRWRDERGRPPRRRSVGPPWPTGARSQRWGASGFSLAELMIAMIILGFGLLVVGAALPVGFHYTQQTVDRATGEAAAENALDQIEQYVRLVRNPINSSNPAGAPRLFADIFQPRYSRIQANGGQLAREDGSVNAAVRLWEPVIKVRPLLPVSMSATAGAWGAQDSAQATLEQRIATWMTQAHIPAGTPDDVKEHDNYALDGGGNRIMFVEATLPSVVAVYPPVSADPRVQDGSTFTVGSFFSNLPASEYVRTQVLPSEVNKAMERTTAWVAFYRRMSYGGSWAKDTTGAWRYVESSDPELYEVIVVAVRRPSEEYRYRVQDPTQSYPTFAGAGGSSPKITGAEPGASAQPGRFGAADARPQFVPINASGPLTSDSGGSDANDGLDLFGLGGDGQELIAGGRASGVDTSVPVPWLVWFKSPEDWLPQMRPGIEFENSTERTLLSDFQAPATLKFVAPAEVAAVMPAGSIFIPAVNDDSPSVLNTPRPAQPTFSNRLAGLIPHAPTTLPIYEVLRVEDIPSPKRTGDKAIIVKNNGFYPWLANGADSSNWPVWVIPPAYKDVDAAGNPLYEQRAPNVAVARRFVRFREIP